MQTKLLQTADKLLFVKHLYGYVSRAINLRVKVQYAERTGMSQSTFRDKMCNHRSFGGLELDVIEGIYLAELGQEIFDKQLDSFIQKMSDGDARTIGESSVDEMNEELANSKLLLTNHA